MHFLLRVRPASLASLIKRLFRINRRPARTAGGLVFMVDPVSQFGDCILSFGEYEPELTAAFRCLIREACAS